MSKRRSGTGRITRGIDPGTLAMKTLAFVQQQLPKWRDNPNRSEVDAEEELNSQLCKHLNVAAPREFPMVHFSHEERQRGCECNCSNKEAAVSMLSSFMVPRISAA